MSKPEVATNVAECVKLSKEKAEIAAELEGAAYEKWKSLPNRPGFPEKFKTEKPIAAHPFAGMPDRLSLLRLIISQLSRMARMKSRLFNTVGFSMVVISARSCHFPLSDRCDRCFSDGLQMRKVLRFHPFPAFSEVRRCMQNGGHSWWMSPHLLSDGNSGAVRFRAQPRTRNIRAGIRETEVIIAKGTEGRRIPCRS